MNSHSDTWKTNLVTFLRINVQTVLKLYEYDIFSTVKDNPTTSNICSALETLFLHKYSPKSVSVLFGSSGNDTGDQLSFWGFLKTFVPQHLSEVLGNLGVKRNYVGRCRVWIRHCLNEGSLGNYLTVIKSSENHIKRFYGEGAIVRDSYNLQKIIELAEMLDELQFQLDLTSPHLNSWLTSKAKQLLDVESSSMICSDYATSLFLLNASSSANRWDRFSKESPYEEIASQNSIFDCVSCEAQTQIYEEDFDPASLNEEPEHSSSCDVDTRTQSQEDSVHANESNFEEAKIPLLSTELPLQPTVENTSDDQENDLTSTEETSSVVDLHSPNLSSPSNNLANKSTWITLTRNSGNVFVTRKKQRHDRHNDQQTASNRPSSSQSPTQSTSPKTLTSLSQWQVVGQGLTMELSAEHVSWLVNIFPGAKCYDMEGGKNCVFNGECQYCHKPLSPETSHLDHYDAKVYCEMCHQLQKAILPHSVVFNWDFSLWPVSEATRLFLTSAYWRPVINLALLNPSLYAVVPELMIVRQLRRKLVILWHLISGCDTSTASALCRVVEQLPSSGPGSRRCYHRSQVPSRRQYMLMSLNDLDLFSMGDLFQVQTGELKSTLLSAINSVALFHLGSCRTCRRHMLICDICESLNRPIWPHEFMSYVHCVSPGCLNVMHTSCLYELQQSICSQGNPAHPVPPNPVDSAGCFPLARKSISKSSNNGDDHQRVNRLKNFQQCRSCHLGQGPAAYGGPKAVCGHYSDPYFTSY